MYKDAYMSEYFSFLQEILLWDVQKCLVWDNDKTKSKSQQEKYQEASEVLGITERPDSPDHPRRPDRPSLIVSGWDENSRPFL